MTGWSVVISVYRDQDVMERNVMRSPAIAHASEVLCQRGYSSVVQAYNAALAQAREDVVVFVHPDVYLCDGWDGELQRVMTWLSANDPTWGVLGLFGTLPDGRHRGFAFSTGLNSFIGVPLGAPIKVRTVDEFVFVVRRSSGLTFDEAIPGAQSQLCATDICLQAEAAGLGVYVVPCFGLHNSNGWRYLPAEFWRPYLYMRRKWWTALPIYVPYTRITRWCWPMVRNSLRANLVGRTIGHRTNARSADVVQLYNALRAGIGRAFGLGCTSRAVQGTPNGGQSNIAHSAVGSMTDG